MNRCELGYPVEDDLIPPERCHCDVKYEVNNCEECPCYNYEYDLINRAIESAECKIYRIKKERDRARSFEHQIKASNQIDLMKITIKALKFYRDEN